MSDAFDDDEDLGGVMEFEMTSQGHHGRQYAQQPDITQLLKDRIAGLLEEQQDHMHTQQQQQPQQQQQEPQPMQEHIDYLDWIDDSDMRQSPLDTVDVFAHFFSCIQGSPISLPTKFFYDA